MCRTQYPDAFQTKLKKLGSLVLQQVFVSLLLNYARACVTYNLSILYSMSCVQICMACSEFMSARLAEWGGGGGGGAAKKIHLQGRAQSELMCRRGASCMVHVFTASQSSIV